MLVVNVSVDTVSHYLDEYASSPALKACGLDQHLKARILSDNCKPRSYATVNRMRSALSILLLDCISNLK